VVIVYAKTITMAKTLTVLRDVIALITSWFVITSVLK
jgi:hypothetical protein